MNPNEMLTERFRDAIRAVLGDPTVEVDPLIRPAQDRKFGDYQSNAAMGLAKRLGKPPRELAQTIIDQLEIDDLCDPPEIAGPGFINLRIKPSVLIGMLTSMDTPQLGVAPLENGHRVVVDMVSVNIAKSMHVGHLRSSVIGDSFCRILARLGYEPIPQNHLGDRGLQNAKVLSELMKHKVDLDTLTLEHLEQAYREANLSCKGETKSLETARSTGAGLHRIIEFEEQVGGAEEELAAAKSTLVKLQQGDQTVLDAWHRITDVTLKKCYELCGVLDLTMGEEHECGESFYRDRLGPVVDELLAAGVAEVSDGAVIVRIPDMDTPLIIRKTDGGYLYATTDLAGIKYRVQELGAERVIYVVDARQRDHFKKVFAAVRMMGWDRLPDRSDDQCAQLIHVPFGSVCGTDGRPLKTRSGDNVKLGDLLTEAARRAEAIVKEKNPNLPDEEKAKVAAAVGIGCIKYADLSNQLNKDYVFEWDRMLAFEGNTGAYLQNQYVRIRSIIRKAPDDVNAEAPFMIETTQEKDLALVLLRYPMVLRGVGETLETNRLCQYLYDLAGAYSAFYTQCPVLKAETTALRDARLRMCGMTERVLGDGLHLLGIRTLERM